MMAIPDRVRECFEAFSMSFAEGEEVSYLEDELGRFKIWAGNIAAHRPPHSRRSLEYRLRDSSGLREMVLLLLQDLVIAIHDVRKQSLSRNTSMTHERPSDEATARPTHGGRELPPNDAPPEDADMFELSDEESIGEDNPVLQALSEVHDVITCLLRFSMTLRRPSRDDQRRDDTAGVATAFVLHDTEHVRTKFPEAPDYLIRRLGKTLSKHRQYFRYRREHHQKLHEGVGEGDARAWELPSTIATSLPNDTSNVQNPFGLSTDSETESAYTATSYAGTSTGNAILRVPPWPISARTDSPFECPICFGIIVAGSETSWRQHVFEDLPPYVCVIENCDSAVKSFSRRREWARHNDTMHDRTWVFPYSCVKPMSSLTELSSHLASEHTLAALPHILQKASIASGQAAEVDKSLICPLCTRPCNSTKSWTKHVGHHLEQLALFSLPMELFSTDTPDNSDEEPNDDGDHSSARSSNAEHPECDGNLPGDSISDVEESQVSELLVPDASNPIVNPMEVSSMRPNDIDAVPYEPSSEHENQDYVRVPAGTSESKIVKDDTLAKEIHELRKMVKRQEEERIAREAGTKIPSEPASDDDDQDFVRSSANKSKSRMMDDDALAKEIRELREMIKHQEEERIAREAELRAEQEAKTAVAKNKPLPDIDQPPVLFKDAVGRKFSFPWHLCKSWKGMESLIKQAFLHVDLIGAHVQEGHYDLTGPDGEIILSQVWETMAKPGMEVWMHIWPLPEDLRTTNNYEPIEATIPDDYLLTRATTLSGSMRERQKEPSDVASSSVQKPKKKELTGFAAWMAGQRPRPSKLR